MTTFQTAPNWTPADHRAAYDEWKRTAPANDDDIFTPFRKPVKVSGKHAELREVSRSIWLWRFLTKTREDTLAGAWIGQAANDNHKDDEDSTHPVVDRLDQGFDAMPSVEDLMACLTTDVVDRVFTVSTRKPKRHHVSEAFPEGLTIEAHWSPVRKAELRVLSTDIETMPTKQVGQTWDEERIYGRRVLKDMPRVVRLGGLKFFRYPANYRHDRRDPGLDGSLFQFRKPEHSAWQRAQDKYRETKSTVKVAPPRNDIWSAMFEDAPVRWVKPGKRRVREFDFTAEESRANLAIAVDNTDAMPEVVKLPVGMPCGSRRVSDSFIGCKPKFSSKGGGAPSFEDMADRAVSLEDARAAAVFIGPDNALALDTAMTAANMTEIGHAFGKTGKHAERFGKQKLVEASHALDRFFAANGFFRAA